MFAATAVLKMFDRKQQKNTVRKEQKFHRNHLSITDSTIKAPKLSKRQASIDGFIPIRTTNEEKREAKIEENSYSVIDKSKMVEGVEKSKTVETDIPSPPKMPVKEFTKINYPGVPISNVSYGIL